MTQSEQDRIEDEVRKRFLGLVDAVNAMDHAAWAAHYSDGGFLSAIAGAQRSDSKKDWTDLVAGYFESRASQRLTPVAVNVVALAPDLALLTSEETAGMRLKDGGESATRHMFTMLWKKEPQGWNILHSHESWV